MVLREYILHETSAMMEFSSKKIANFSPISFQLEKSLKGKTKKKSLKTYPQSCPYCKKQNLKGKKALQQHIQAKHPHLSRKRKKIKELKDTEELLFPELEILTNQCPICHAKFNSVDQTYNHFQGTHHQNTAMLDENLSSQFQAVKQISELFSIIMMPLPIMFRGKSDNWILNYLISMQTGLITRDKYFAKKAMLWISPVFLLWKNTIIKLS
ncbi:hypothetical protein [Candidatus Harpocratesius sp.]